MDLENKDFKRKIPKSCFPQHQNEHGKFTDLCRHCQHQGLINCLGHAKDKIGKIRKESDWFIVFWVTIVNSCDILQPIWQSFTYLYSKVKAKWQKKYISLKNNIVKLFVSELSVILL